MVMPPCGGFDYVARLAEPTPTGGFTSKASVRIPVPETGDTLTENRLVGLEPTLSIEDAGLEPNPGPVRPFVLRSRLTFTAALFRRALVKSASLYVDKALTSRLRAGDLIHASRSANGGVGLSVLRDEVLIVAVGAVTDVPLGNGVSASIPWDLVKQAEAIFAERSLGFKFREWPIELRAGHRSVIQFEGKATLDAYAAEIIHGPRWGIPGQSECVAIYQADMFPDAVMHASAILIDDGVELAKF